VVLTFNSFEIIVDIMNRNVTKCVMKCVMKSTLF